MYDEFKGKWVVRARGGRTGPGSCPVAGFGMSGVDPGLLLAELVHMQSGEMAESAVRPNNSLAGRV